MYIVTYYNNCKGTMQPLFFGLFKLRVHCAEYVWRRWSLHFIPTGLQMLRVTVIVVQVAQFTVSSRLYACHSCRNCTSYTRPSVMLCQFFFFLFFNAGCQNNITACHVWLVKYHFWESLPCQTLRCVRCVYKMFDFICMWSVKCSPKHTDKCCVF